MHFEDVALIKGVLTFMPEGQSCNKCELLKSEKVTQNIALSVYLYLYFVLFLSLAKQTCINGLRHSRNGLCI